MPGEPFTVLKLPLGVTSEPVTFAGIVSSQELPPWLAENIPPAAISDPRGFIRDARAVVDAVAKYVTWF